MDGFLNDVSITLLVSPLVLWGAFLVVLAVVAVIALTLMYHWREYSFNKLVFGRAVVVYLAVSIVIVAASVVSLLRFSATLP